MIKVDKLVLFLFFFFNDHFPELSQLEYIVMQIWAHQKTKKNWSCELINYTQLYAKGF